jgi:Secretion system C-terminal sorting domain
VLVANLTLFQIQEKMKKIFTTLLLAIATTTAFAQFPLYSQSSRYLNYADPSDSISYNYPASYTTSTDMAKILFDSRLGEIPVNSNFVATCNSYTLFSDTNSQIVGCPFWDSINFQKNAAEFVTQSISHPASYNFFDKVYKTYSYNANNNFTKIEDSVISTPSWTKLKKLYSYTSTGSQEVVSSIYYYYRFTAADTLRLLEVDSFVYTGTSNLPTKFIQLQKDPNDSLKIYNEVTYYHNLQNKLDSMQRRIVNYPFNTPTLPYRMTIFNRNAAGKILDILERGSNNSINFNTIARTDTFYYKAGNTSIYPDSINAWENGNPTRWESFKYNSNNLLVNHKLYFRDNAGQPELQWTYNWYYEKTGSNPTAISNGNLQNEPIIISPNPTNGNFTLAKKDFSKVYIADMQGKTHVLQATNSMYSIANLPVGVYIIKAVDSDGTVHTNKLIKQ